MASSPITNDTPAATGNATHCMPRWSRYRGEPLDDNGRCSIKLAGGQSTPLSPDASTVTVDYLRHQGQYWRAVLPLGGVERVYGQAFNFSKPKTRRGDHGPEIRYRKSGLPERTVPIMNHVQSRFSFRDDQPVKLYPLGGETSGPPADEVYDVVYSIEATGPPGVSYNLRDAILGNLVCAHRFVSIQEVVFERIAVENQYVLETPPLALEPSETRALLAKSLERSHLAGMDEPYYLFRCGATNNCTSTPFRMLDEVVNYTPRERLGALLYRLPLNPRLYLRLRGLDPSPKQYSFLREEFLDYLEDPATQKRRREHVRQAVQVRRSASRGECDEEQKRSQRGAS
ncbi:MAG: hypothetical protein AAGF31_10105 [Planctomycetota bacterium]